MLLRWHYLQQQVTSLTKGGSPTDLHIQIFQKQLDMIFRGKTPIYNGVIGSLKPLGI